MSYGNPDCHYGDHQWNGGGICSGCGKQLRCYCGAFVREDGIEKHMETCSVVARYERKARAAA